MPQLKIQALGSNELLKLVSNSSNNYIRFNDSEDNRYAAVGYYQSCAFLSNEKANYARLAITDAGIPQYWSNNSSTTAQEILHTGNYNSYIPTKTGVGASGTWNISITGNALTVDYPKGFTHRHTASEWGAISSINYNLITQWNMGANGGSVAFLQYPDDDQISVKIDGYFYQNEGKYQVLDTSGGIIFNSIEENNHNGVLCVKNTNTYTGTGYHSPLRVMSPNATGSQCIMVGPDNSQRNAGYMAFYNTGISGSTDNRLSFGLYAVDNVLNIMGNGNVGIGTTNPLTNFVVYQESGTGNVANFSSSGSNTWLYIKTGATTNSASVGYYKGFAMIANEKTYSRIGVNDSGIAQYWTDSDGTGKYNIILGNGWSNSGPIKLSPGQGIANASTNYISAGRGYSTGSGLYGIKLVATEQDDAISGVGQDCLGKAYELSLCAALSTAGAGYITFCGHKIDSPTTYTELGFFDGSGNFKYSGGLVATSGKGYGPSLPSASYYGQVFFLV